MRVEFIPTHDVHNFYLRWEIFPEGKERDLLRALGGPLTLELETSNFVDLAGVAHETAKFKVAIWPHPGDRNFGQARFTDVDSRRRFWVNLQDAVGTTVVDFLYDRAPDTVRKEGVTITVPERGGARVVREAVAS